MVAAISVIPGAHPCHSERSEESPVSGVRFFTPLRYVQNDMGSALRSE